MAALAELTRTSTVTQHDARERRRSSCSSRRGGRISLRVREKSFHVDTRPGATRQIREGRAAGGLGQLYFDGKLVANTEIPVTTPILFGIRGTHMWLRRRGSGSADIHVAVHVHPAPSTRSPSTPSATCSSTTTTGPRTTKQKGPCCWRASDTETAQSADSQPSSVWSRLLNTPGGPLSRLRLNLRQPPTRD